MPFDLIGPKFGVCRASHQSIRKLVRAEMNARCLKTGFFAASLVQIVKILAYFDLNTAQAIFRVPSSNIFNVIEYEFWCEIYKSVEPGSILRISSFS